MWVELTETHTRRCNQTSELVYHMFLTKIINSCCTSTKRYTNSIKNYWWDKRLQQEIWQWVIFLVFSIFYILYIYCIFFVYQQKLYQLRIQVLLETLVQPPSSYKTFSLNRWSLSGWANKGMAREKRFAKFVPFFGNLHPYCERFRSYSRKLVSINGGSTTMMLHNLSVGSVRSKNIRPKIGQNCKQKNSIIS